jgi:signal transduction histidine kinase
VYKGIRLVLVQHIEGWHGGRVWIEGKWSKGAIFDFTFPGRKENKDA